MTVQVDDVRTLTTLRNALADWDHVQSDLIFKGAASERPLVTIAIPTFRRAELLIDTLQSAMAQRFDRPYEIIVVDNDPDTEDFALVLERLPALKLRNFRYFVNRENLGMFGNFNRCIRLARGQWLTILNDDDLLDGHYLSTIFSVLDKNPRTDGIVCQKAVLDQRQSVQTWSPSFPRKVAKRILTEACFQGKPSRRIRPRKYFWSAITGNVVGFTFRTQAGVDLGGFYTEEYPSDTWFYARFAASYRLRQHRAVAVRIRVAENESANRETVKRSLLLGYTLVQALEKTEVPRWWRRITPLLIARHRTHLESYWRIHLPASEIEDMLNIKLPPDRPLLYKALRVMLRGF